MLSSQGTSGDSGSSAKEPKPDATPHILILIHEHDGFERVAYLMREMVKFWQRDGMRVTVQRGLGPFIPADLAVLHVNLTQTPREYIDILQRYPRILNGNVLDISKRRISRQQLTKARDGAGPVIVKTNCNYGGSSEAILTRKRGGCGKVIYKIRQLLPWSFRAEFLDYRIFPSAREVPRAVWFNPDLVVERFRSERQNEFYCLRTWVFLGDRETNSISYSHQPIVKSSNIIHREAVAEIPAELRQIRRELGFDFGKFDYAIVEGEVVLYDANRTPNIGDVSEQFWAHIEMLSQGIRSFLPVDSSGQKC